MDILGKPVLLRMLERVQASKLRGTLVVATTTDKEDDIIQKLCSENNILYYRGDRLDLLDRHYQAAGVIGQLNRSQTDVKHFRPDVVVKIPSDCPLIDPSIIDRVLQYYLDNTFDYVSNLHPATYPDGNDVEAMSFATLETAWREAKKTFEREHTTPYIWEHPERFTIGNVIWETGLDYSMSHRWTIDYPEDFAFIKAVYEHLYPQNPNFGCKEIIELTDKNPAIFALNSKYAGVNWYRNHLGDLKTIKADQTKQLK